MEDYFQGQCGDNQEDDSLLVVNTGSICFLCLNIYSSGNNHHHPIKVEDGSPVEQQTFQLTRIFRYLNLNVTDIFNSTSWNNMSINLCQECSAVTGNLSDLCSELELLQMKVDHCLESFSGKLQQSKGKQIEGQLVSSNSGNYNSIKTLREETRKSCEKKLKSAIPKVALTRLPAQSPDMTNEPIVNHVTSIRMEPQYMKCNQCNSKFQSRSAYLNHQNFDCPLLKLEISPIPASPENSSVPAPEDPLSPKNGYRKCTLCKPPRPVSTKAKDFRRHNIILHIESIFPGCKLPHISESDFKIYCDHVVKVEILSCRKITKKNNPSRQCLYCTKSFQDNNALRYHLCVEHQSILARKILALQKTSSVEEIKQMSAIACRNDLLKCDACGMTFAHKCSFRKHKEHTCKYGPRKPWPQKKKYKVKCGTCGRRFVSERDFLEHREIEHPVEGGDMDETGESSQYFIEGYDETEMEEDDSNDQFEQGNSGQEVDQFADSAQYDDQSNNVVMIIPD